MPPSLGGGEVSATAMKLLERSEFDGVPQPELIAECVVRYVSSRCGKARSGLRAAMNFYRDDPKRRGVARLLTKVHSHE